MDVEVMTVDAAMGGAPGGDGIPVPTSCQAGSFPGGSADIGRYCAKAGTTACR